MSICTSIPGFKWALQNEVQLCCTLYKWFLLIVAVGGLCMPTNECSKGRELLATGHAIKQFPQPSSPTSKHVQISKLRCHCLFCFVHQAIKPLAWDLSEDRYPDTDPWACMYSLPFLPSFSLLLWVK